jgi:cytochrome c oxidase assembly protein subunit 15
VSAEIRNFRRWALAATITTYFLIFVGGLVRVSGAGLGCPDWPRCFGSWIPPLSREQVPPEFNAGSFNVTLAWIEYINRLVGVVVGILIAGTAILAIKNFRTEKRILIPSVFAALLVAFQGWYGSVVVSSKLLPHTVSLHLVLALTIVSLLIYVTQTVYYLGNDQKLPEKGVNGGLRRGVLILWVLAIIQIVLGTQVRSEIELILREFPLLFEREVLTVLGPINFVHAVWGILIALIAFFIAFRLVRKREETTLTARIIGGIAVLLLVIQIVIGSALEIFGLPAILQVFHLWTASLFIGTLLILYTELVYRKGA